MATSLFIDQLCKRCGGYRFAPYNSNTSATVKLCHCPTITKAKIIEELKKRFREKFKDEM
jgi:hypothetical protein